MGMAASQARYLALLARKSNCEFEGQQINQARLNLSNQSANLFNQMLGLDVPVPPSTQDFTKKQYSFTDGVSKYTVDKWNQLAEPDSEGYNYVVTYHYKSDVYTGYQKQKSDPQVQFSIPGAYPASDSYKEQIRNIQAALKDITTCQTNYDEKLSAYKTLAAKAAQLSTYADNKTSSNVIKCTYDEESKSYTVRTQNKTDDEWKLLEFSTEGTDDAPGAVDTYYKDGIYYKINNPQGTTFDDKYEKIEKPATLHAKFAEHTYKQDSTTQEVKDAIKALRDMGALDKDFDESTVFYDETTKAIAFKSDLANCEKGSKSILPLYYYNDKSKAESPDDVTTVKSMQDELNVAQNEMNAAKNLLDVAKAGYEALNVPKYVGNAQLTPLSELTDIQLAEIKQIIADMDKDEIVTKIKDCFETFDETYDNSTYIGGLYTYEQGGKTYITTYYDMADDINQGEGINHIDNQPKMPYYAAEYISTDISKTSKALLETDSSGRFTSIRFADDSIKYTLDVETITDDAAYKDAMNQYYYETAKYDKMVQDINAKTSIIQQEDQELELRLKQLDTEQNALSTEMEAVQKVVKDNVDKSFKTFNG